MKYFRGFSVTLVTATKGHVERYTRSRVMVTQTVITPLKSKIDICIYKREREREREREIDQCV